MTPHERDTLLAIRDMAEAHAAEAAALLCGGSMRYIVVRIDDLLAGVTA